MSAKSPVISGILLLAACSSPVDTPTAPPSDVGIQSSSAASLRSTDRTVSVFLKYKPTATFDRIRAARERGAAFAYDLLDQRTLALDVPLSLVDSIRSLAWVDSVEVDSSANFLLADSYPWGVDSSGAHTVHSYARGTGVKVAFIDGGARCTIADITSRIVGGYDFVASSSTFCQNTQIATNALDHGTSVAQVLGSSINGSGWVGMAPEATLYNLRVCDANSNCSSARIASALNWSVTNNMKVVSVSIGNCGEALPAAIVNAMTSLYQSNIVQTWAGGNGSHDGCGNSTHISSYLTRPGVLGVTAYWQNVGYVPDFSHNQYLDLSAPTDVQTISLFGAGFPTFGGTSASTPHVAGAAALLIGLGFTGVDLISQRLTSTAIDRGTPGFDNYYGYGVLNAGAAAAIRPIVSIITGPTPPITTAGSYGLSAQVIQGVPPFGIQWTVHYSNGVLPDVTTPFGSSNYSLQVPAGSYSITVTATPKETTYLRIGTAYQLDYPVCTGGQGPAFGGNVTPNGAGGC